MQLANKLLGETPLQCLKRLRETGVYTENDKVTYAGRLDPAAAGLMIFLDKKSEILDKQKYLSLTKEYEYEILCGMSTDTYDLLGKITKTDFCIKPNKNNIKDIINEFVGDFVFPYPKYSGKTLKGKKLFSLKNLLKKDIPTRQMNIFKNEYIGESTVSKKEITERVEKILNTVEGDFRNTEIKNIWNDFIEKSESDTFLIIKAKMFCASGVYVRSVVNEISNKIKTPMCTYSINRTKIGEYHI